MNEGFAFFLLVIVVEFNKGEMLVESHGNLFINDKMSLIQNDLTHLEYSKWPLKFEKG